MSLRRRRSPAKLSDDDKLKELERSWDLLGREDPLWAILSVPEKRHGGWNLTEFLATGDREVVETFARMDNLGLSVRLHRALDFGCGIGRVSRALSNYFKQVDGLDISRAMIDRGREVNSDIPNLGFQQVIDLPLPFADGTFDFIYSRLVLQHVPTDLAIQYVRDFVRVLESGGIAMFQAPSLVLKGKSPGASEISLSGERAYIEMHVHARQRVEKTVLKAGGQILAVEDDPCAGENFESLRYWVSRLDAHTPTPQTYSESV